MSEKINFRPLAGDIRPPVRPNRKRGPILAGAVRPPRNPKPGAKIPPMAGKVIPPSKMPNKKAVIIASAITAAFVAAVATIISKIKGGSVNK